MNQETRLIIAINDLYDKYRFLNLKEEDLKSLVALEFDRALKIVNVDPTKKIDVTLIECLEERFHSIIRKRLKNKKWDFIDGLIKQTIKVTDDQDLANQELESFFLFFKDYSFEEDTYYTLFQYPEIESLIKVLAQNNFRTSNKNIQKLLDIYGSIHTCLEKDNIPNYDQLYSLEARKRAILNEEETKKLLVLAKHNNQEAIELLIYHNLGLVFFVIGKYFNNAYEPSSFMDLVQEGNMGLLHAIKKFDLTRDNTFATYAIIWIRQQISRYLKDNYSLINAPYLVKDLVILIKRVSKEYETKNGHLPSAKELSQLLKIPYSRIQELIYYANLNIISLNEVTIKDDEQSSLENVIGDDGVNIEEDITSNNLHNDLCSLIEASSLKDKELLVLIMRYNLDGKGYRTLEHIASLLGVTRETIRKYEVKSLENLRKSVNGTGLEEYLGIEANNFRKKSHPEAQYHMKGRVFSYQDAIKCITFMEKELARKKTKTIYDYIDADIADIDLAIERLTIKEKKLIYCRYGHNLLNPILNNRMGKSEKTILYGKIIPKIKRLLKDKQ